MKKTFQLKVPGQADPRVVESIKHEVNKYVKRERRKTVPDGFDLWSFNCRVGADQAGAEVTPLKEVIRAIDGVAGTGAAGVYVEILAAPAHWPRPAAIPPATGEGDAPARENA